MQDDPTTIAAVREGLDRFLERYSAKDLDGVLACFALGDDGVFIGSGADGWCTGDTGLRRQVERDFGQAEWLSVEMGHAWITTRERTSWCAVNATVRAQF